ncbi:MAG: S8 family serine peptidase [Dehalococcoidia bacterium]
MSVSSLIVAVLGWHLLAIGAPAAWGLAPDRSGVLIVMVDSQYQDHAAHTAALLRQTAPGVKITFVSAFDHGVIEAIDAAADLDPDIVVITLSTEVDFPAMRQAIGRFRGLVVASAGNDGAAQPRYPAAYPGVLSVGATTRQGTLAPFSQRTPTVAILAPGDDVPLAPGIAWRGTSAAAPQVAGVAALVRSVGPHLSAMEIRATLIATARPVCHEAGCGAGLVDAAAAVRLARVSPKRPQDRR